jgi:hypothetical protein
MTFKERHLLQESKIAGGMLLGGLGGAGLGALMKYHQLTGDLDAAGIDTNDLPETFQNAISHSAGAAARQGVVPGILAGGLAGGAAHLLSPKKK